MLDNYKIMSIKQSLIIQQDEKNLDEVSFSNHAFEFARFYERHKLLFDEIAGVKKRIVMINNYPTEIEITNTNFLMGIKRLDSFIIDNISYIENELDKEDIKSNMNKLQHKFLNDTEYAEFSSRNNNNLSQNEEIIFINKYFDYLIDCFSIGNKMFRLMQGSLMIATQDMKKGLKFYDFKPFAENLSRYRDEVSNMLSDIRMSEIFNCYKKVVAFHYTYRFIVSESDCQTLDELIMLLRNYLLSNEMIELIKESKKKQTYREKDIFSETEFFKKHLSKIYEKTNENLSERNILPKINKKIMIDRTLI